MALALALLTSLTLAAEPAPDARLFIAAGAPSRAAAQKLAAGLKLPRELVLAPGYPKLIDSGTVPGLRAGFWLVVLGACADGPGAPQTHANGLAALIQRGLKGAYAKPVAQQDTTTCPLWLEGTGRDTPAPTVPWARRDDLPTLRAAARAFHAASSPLGADILLRRALALGDEDPATIDLYRMVEFVLEDVPFRLPD